MPPVPGETPQRGNGAVGLAYYLGQHAGMTLRELGKCMGEVEYAAVSVAIARFQNRLKTERSLQRRVKQIEKLLKVDSAEKPIRWREFPARGGPRKHFRLILGHPLCRDFSYRGVLQQNRKLRCDPIMPFRTCAMRVFEGPPSQPRKPRTNQLLRQHKYLMCVYIL